MLTLLFARSFRGEVLTVPRYEGTRAGRRPAKDRLDIVGEAVVAVGGVKLSHRQKVLIDVLGQAARP